MLERKPHRLADDERERVIAALRETVGAHREVAFAYLFGSFVAGGPFRDIDVAVYMEPTSTRDDSEVDLELELTAALTEKVRLPVEVQLLNRAPIPFAYHALRGKLLLARDPDALARFIEYVVPRYLDMKPLLRHATKEAFGG